MDPTGGSSTWPLCCAPCTDTMEVCESLEHPSGSRHRLPETRYTASGEVVEEHDRVVDAIHLYIVQACGCFILVDDFCWNGNLLQRRRVRAIVTRLRPVPGKFLAIVGQDPSDSKSSRLHVDIFRFCFHSCEVCSTDSAEMIDNSPEVSNFNRLCLKLNPFICIYRRFFPSSDSATNLSAKCQYKLSGPNPFTLLKWTLQFEWCVLQCGSKNGHQKHMYSK